MTRFIFANTDSGAGCLKQSGIAETVLGLNYQLVHGPVPLTDAPLDLFAARTTLWPPGTDDFEVEMTGQEVPSELVNASQTAQGADAVELWIDPTPNAQLQCLQLLDWLQSEDRIPNKLYACFLDHPLDGQTPEWAANLRPKLVRVDAPMCELATRSWRAFRQTSPRSWFNLRTTDLGSLPRLSMTVECLLRELPDATTGLIETQRRMLDMVSAGFDNPRDLLTNEYWRGEDAVFDYWESGRLLCELANCNEPALLGINGEEFTLDLHDDIDRLKSFWRNHLDLTSFGRALLDGREDFSRHNSICRWWGGTKLTSKNLWRWNSENLQLIEPA